MSLSNHTRDALRLGEKENQLSTLIFCHISSASFAIFATLRFLLPPARKLLVLDSSAGEFALLTRGSSSNQGEVGVLYKQILLQSTNPHQKRTPPGPFSNHNHNNHPAILDILLVHSSCLSFSHTQFESASWYTQSLAKALPRALVTYPGPPARGRPLVHDAGIKCCNHPAICCS